MAADQIHVDWPATGATLYFTIENDSNQIWETVGSAFETRVVANWDNTGVDSYVIAMSESPGSSYHYIGTSDSAITSGDYIVRIREQVGGSKLVSDPVIASALIKWDGTVIIRDSQSDIDWVDGGRLDLLLDAIPTTKTGYSLVSTGLDLVLIDGRTLPNALEIIAAVCVGRVSGAGTGTEVFVGLDEATTRATVTVDAVGNRTDVVYVG